MINQSYSRLITHSQRQAGNSLHPPPGQFCTCAWKAHRIGCFQNSSFCFIRHPKCTKICSNKMKNESSGIDCTQTTNRHSTNPTFAQRLADLSSEFLRSICAHFSTKGRRENCRASDEQTAVTISSLIASLGAPPLCAPSSSVKLID